MKGIAFTVKRKIVLLSLLLNVILWIISGVSIYQFISSQLYQNLDAFLETEAIGTADSIVAVLSSEYRGKDGSPSASHISRSLDDPAFFKVALSWFDERKDQPKPYKTTVTIYNMDGKPLVSSNATFSPERLSEDFLAELAVERRFFSSTLSVEPTSSRSHEVRHAYAVVGFRNIDAAIVEVLTLGDSVNASLASLARGFFLALPILLFLAFSIELYLLKQAFKPVQDIISAARSISERNLKLRVPLPSASDEIRDLAETLNTMLDRIDQAFDYQTRLVEDISHQLRTPLSILKGELETGLRRVRTAKEYEEILSSNLDEVNRIIRVTENLLLIVHYENGSAVMNLNRLDLNALAEECVEHMMPVLNQKRIRVEMDSSGSARISGDRHKLRQVLLNLLDNSIKYSGEDSLIRLRTESSRDRVYFRIADQGIGISAEDIPHVFERFYRSREARREKGFGLGLNICKSIVTLHGGSIFVQSEPGNGTTVTLEFPANSPSAV